MINNNESYRNSKVTSEECNTWLNNFYTNNTIMIDYLAENFVNHPAPHALIQYLIMEVKKKFSKLTPTVIINLLTDRILQYLGSEYNEDIDFAKAFYNLVEFGFNPEDNKYKSALNQDHIIDLFEKEYSFDIAEYFTSLIYNKLKSKRNVKEWYDKDDPYRIPKYAFDFSTISELKYAFKREFWFGGRVDKAYINRNDYGHEYSNIFINGYDGRQFKAYVKPNNFLEISSGIRNLRFNHYDIVIHGKISKQKGSDEIILNADSFASYNFNTIRWFPKRMIHLNSTILVDPSGSFPSFDL